MLQRRRRRARLPAYVVRRLPLLRACRCLPHATAAAATSIAAAVSAAAAAPAASTAATVFVLGPAVGLLYELPRDRPVHGALRTGPLLLQRGLARPGVPRGAAVPRSALLRRPVLLAIATDPAISAVSTVIAVSRSTRTVSRAATATAANSTGSAALAGTGRLLGCLRNGRLPLVWAPWRVLPRRLGWGRLPGKLVLRIPLLRRSGACGA